MSAKLYLCIAKEKGYTPVLDFVSAALQDQFLVNTNNLVDLYSLIEELDKQLMPSNPDGSRPEHQQLLEMHHTFVQQLPRIAYYGRSLDSRLHVLLPAQYVVVNGASLAMHLSIPRSALDILEQGRSVFWQQALWLRTKFDSLPTHLTSQLTLVAAQLEKASHGQLTGHLHLSPGDIAIKGHILTETFQSLVNQARNQPGLQGFMLPYGYEQLMQAANRGPIVTLLASRRSCCAIVLCPGMQEPISILLSDLDEVTILGLAMDLQDTVCEHREASAERLLVKSGGKTATVLGALSSFDILKKLWLAVVNPILKALTLAVGDIVCLIMDPTDSFCTVCNWARSGPLVVVSNWSICIFTSPCCWNL